jgi:hypothetical protein
LNTLYPYSSSPEELDTRESLSNIIESAINHYTNLKHEQIFGIASSISGEKATCYIFPKTVDYRHYIYETSQFIELDIDIIFSRMHISRIAYGAISETLETFDKILRQGDFKELNDLLKIQERMQIKYDWGYAGIKHQPELLSEIKDINSIIDKIKVDHPVLLDKFYYWLELELFYKEAVNQFEKFIDNPYDAATYEEKTDFVNWMAEWINLGNYRCNEHLHSLMNERNFTFRKSPYSLPSCDSNDKHFYFYTFYAGTLQSICTGALFDASNQFLGSNKKDLGRVSKNKIDTFLQSYKQREAFHHCSGYGNCIQNAANTHRDKVLLLEVETDKELFTNFGDGALQFWISIDDLKAMHFDNAFMTAECT